MLYARVRSTLAGLAAFAASLAAALAGASPAAARDVVVRSFDGTPIAASFFPAAGLKRGQRAPTILESHGWGGSRDTNPDSASSEQTGNVGLGPLRRAGFNVLTWDARGWGQSGGTIEVDSKDFEGRDVSALLSWLARQPEARLDRRGDPRVGMTGVSYAGGIEYVTAGIDGRIDAIAPIIAWHSLLTSLYKQQSVKAGWGSILYGAAAGHRTDPHITSAFTTGVSSGSFLPSDQSWFASRGPGALVRAIRVPTLLVEGTPDTLFTLQEAITNFRTLRHDRVPAKMVWFCGGHGACLTGSGPPGHVQADVLAWLKRYVARRRSVRTGPRFEWLADDAVWRSARHYPPKPAPPLTANGGGTLVVTPTDTSGTPISAGRAVNAVNLPVPPPAAPKLLVGAPRLSLTYSGTGSAPAGHVYAQVVDEARGLVVGNQATPLALTLDGRPHALSLPLEAIASTAAAGARYTLQLTGGTQVYGPARFAGVISFSNVRLVLPAVAPPPRSCTTRRRVTIRLARRIVSARVTANGHRVRVRRRHGRLVAVVRLRASTVRVRIKGRTRSGRVVRQTRVYHRCPTS